MGDSVLWLGRPALKIEGRALQSHGGRLEVGALHILEGILNGLPACRQLGGRALSGIAAASEEEVVISGQARSKSGAQGYTASGTYISEEAGAVSRHRRIILLEPSKPLPRKRTKEKKKEKNIAAEQRPSHASILCPIYPLQHQK